MKKIKEVYKEVEEENYMGCIDNQTEEEKALNYKQSEVVASVAPVVWTEKSSYRSFPIRNQDGSGTCVAQTEAKEQSIWLLNKYGVWVDMSASFRYQQRTNTESQGCTSSDIYSVFPKLGNIYESLMPSQNLSESQIMAVPRPEYLKDIAKVYNFKRIKLPIDFETVASTIQETGKGVMVWFKLSMAEWTTIPQVLPQPTTSGHSVIAVDWTLKDGKKYLVIDDSWGLSYAMNGQRLISEEYFKARCFLASYIMDFKVSVGIINEKPVFDGSIISAQKCFKYLGYFPLNVSEVENWGNITRSACIKFQKANNIYPQLGNFGDFTKAKLKELFN